MSLPTLAQVNALRANLANAKSLLQQARAEIRKVRDFALHNETLASSAGSLTLANAYIRALDPTDYDTQLDKVQTQVEGVSIPQHSVPDLSGDEDGESDAECDFCGQKIA